ncbi:MAG: outer membrane beta-barrel protein, partial [Saprospiraceae bacterium]|nr:outer membrane beta-barrel protein [Saprospiraceae bacterium]
MNKILCLSFALLMAAGALAQDVKHVHVLGLVKDPDGNPLATATAVLLDVQDSTIVGFGITNAEGAFSIKRIQPASYVLQVSYVGLATHSEVLEVPADEAELKLDLITLELQALDGVTVTADRIPMQIVKDTVAYNAAAFRTQPNDVVEDLLKKLPGIEVEQDGTIKAQGEEVTQVLVDGKEFFGKDASIATKNLPANAVDKVEVFDKKSDLAEFTGIDDGQDEKAINLELKEDHKKGVFGSLTAGYGTEERYQSKAQINRFDKNTQLSILGMFNNVNQQGFSPDDYIQFAGGMASLMRNSGSGGRVQLGGNGVAISNGLSDGFVETAAFGLNLNRDFGKKADLNLSYFYSGIENQVEQEIRRENILSSALSFNTAEDENQLTENRNHRLNSFFEWKIDSMQNLRVRGSLAFNNSAFENTAVSESLTSLGDLRNSTERQNEMGRDNLAYNLSATYRTKFAKRGRSLSLSANLRNRQDEQMILLQSLNVLAATPTKPAVSDALEQDQEQTNDLQEYGWTVNYLEPVGKNTYMGLEYTRSNDATQLKRDVYDLLDDRELIEQLSNHYNRDYLFDRAGVSFRWLKGKSNLSTTFNIQQSKLDGEILSNESTIRQKNLNFLPSLRWNFDVASSKKILLQYRTSVNEPSLEQLQPIADNSNPLNIYIGNPDLVPAYSHRLQLRYFSFSQFSMTNFFATLTGTYTNNAIVNARTIDERLTQITKPVNVDNTYRASAFVGFGTPIKAIGSRLNLHANYSYNRSVAFINQVEDFTSRNNTSLDLSFDNLKKDVLDLRLGARIGSSNT